MKPMDKIRKQHEDILMLTGRISVDLETAINPGTASALLDTIGQLSTLLEEHLLLEDDFLYPALKKRPKKEIRDIASLFYIELGGIRNAFSEYSAKWTSPENIIQSHPHFMSESKALLVALRHRIAKEDNELFPLLEA